MSEVIVIRKTQLDALADSVPDKASLQRELKMQYDADPGGIYNFITLFVRDPKNALFVIKGDGSLDWEVLCTLNDALDEDQSFKDISDLEKDHIINRVYTALYPDLVALVKARAATAMVRECMKHPPLLHIAGLEPAESENVVLLLQEARTTAANLKLNALQLFVDGKLDKLLSNNPRIAAFNRLPDAKKTHARQQITQRMKWEPPRLSEQPPAAPTDSTTITASI